MERNGRDTLKRIEKCKEEATKLLRILEAFPKVSDIYDFIQVLRAWVKQLDDCINIQKNLTVYVVVERAVMEDIFTNLLKLHDKLTSLMKGNALVRTLKTFALRRSLENISLELSRDIEKVHRDISNNLNEEKRHWEKERVRSVTISNPPSSHITGVRTRYSTSSAPDISIQSTPSQNIPTSRPTSQTNFSPNNKNHSTARQSPPSKSLPSIPNNSIISSPDKNRSDKARCNSEISTRRTLAGSTSPQQTERIKKDVLKPQVHSPRLYNSPRQVEIHEEAIGEESDLSELEGTFTSASDSPALNSPVSSPNTFGPKSQVRYGPVNDVRQKAAEEQGLGTTVNGSGCIYGLLSPVLSRSTSSNNSFIDGLSSPQTPKSQINGLASHLIKDEEGMQFWSHFSNGQSFFVEWPAFEAQYCATLGIRSLSVEQKTVLRHILDSGTAVSGITAYRFSEFLKGFGPLSQSLHNLTHILQQPWFHGFLSRTEVNRLLYDQPPGTFLLRFSKSQPGSFALVLVPEHNQTQHILIQSLYPLPGFTISESSNSSPSPKKHYPKLWDLLSYYVENKTLLYPYTSDFIPQPWFWGDLTSSEAADIIKDSTPGTFLIRFSGTKSSSSSFSNLRSNEESQQSELCFASTKVENNGEIRHTRIKKTPSGSWRDEGGAQEYRTMSELVEACGNVLRSPLISERSDLYGMRRKKSLFGDWKEEIKREKTKGVERKDDYYLEAGIGGVESWNGGGGGSEYGVLNVRRPSVK
eukprot:TRINITY_DN1454_c0_g1_i1.p1 TRINITY_DN1454_c0_g1~~TRINITY_DN1454_c0_g1_i1.p1  ORF type:complete len:753 (-),score=114.84 TRINITY_DN1454_c0_g1_i1:119-2377(-)